MFTTAGEACFTMVTMGLDAADEAANALPLIASTNAKTKLTNLLPVILITQAPP
jgi:hypothetical protein